MSRENVRHYSYFRYVVYFYFSFFSGSMAFLLSKYKYFNKWFHLKKMPCVFPCLSLTIYLKICREKLNQNKPDLGVSIQAQLYRDRYIDI